MRRRLAVLFAVVPLAACEAHPVVRLVDGVAVPHRAISIRAYAAYARGAVAEATGALNVALLEYRRATDADSGGVEPWVREGAVSCALGSYEAAGTAFAHAEERDASYEPLWTERARCELAHGDPKRALEAAERAEALDPSSDDAVRAHAEALDKTGDAAGAIRELTALAIERPTPVTFRLELEIAKRTGDDATAHAAERGLDTTGAPSETPDQRSALDQAISAGDIETASHVGRRVGQSPSDIAVRAAALGRYDVARKIADPILRANPHDADALAAAAASRDPSDVSGLDALLSVSRPSAPSGISKLGKLILLEALYRRIGKGVLDGAALPNDGDLTDDAERAVVSRLRAAQK